MSLSFGFVALSFGFLVATVCTLRRPTLLRCGGHCGWWISERIKSARVHDTFGIRTAQRSRPPQHGKLWCVHKLHIGDLAARERALLGTAARREGTHSAPGASSDCLSALQSLDCTFRFLVSSSSFKRLRAAAARHRCCARSSCAGGRALRLRQWPVG